MADAIQKLHGLPERLQRLRVPVLVLICVLGMTASVLFAEKTRRTHKQVVALTFHRDVEDSLMLISTSVDLAMEQVRTLATFIRSARRVDQQEFSSFVLPALRRYPTIHSFAWVPKIDAAERAAFERAASVALGEPFVLTEAGPDEGRAPAGQREAYYPITFVEPIASLRRTLGFDLGTAPQRMRAMRQAADEDRLVTTPPMILRDPAGDYRGFFAFTPIYRDGLHPATPEARRAALLGFATAAFRVEDVVDHTLGQLHEPELHVYLFDTALPEGEQLLYARYGDAPAGLTPEDVARAAPLHASRQVMVGGRPWLLMATPSPRYVAQIAGGGPWRVLFIGITLTTLVGLVLWGMIRSSDQMAVFARSREEVNEALRERIREREEAEEALAQANRELREVNADMERFVGAVSHDLKSPLVAAEMLISVMKQAVAKGDLAKVGDTAAQIAKACSRMRRIIDDLLEHQRAGFADLRTSPVDLTEVALHVVEDHREEAMGRGVHVHLQDDMPTIRADRGRVTAMLDNLVANALRYGVTSEEPAVDIGTEVVDGEVRLFVRDNGPGIPHDERERIWELFQRIGRDEEGTGIGLAIVRRAADAHGGRAWLECPPEGGSVFWIAFPKERVIKPERPRAIAAAEATA